MRSLDPAFLNSLRLSIEQGATLRKIGEHKGRQALFERQTPEVLETLKHQWYESPRVSRCSGQCDPDRKTHSIE